VSEIVTGEAVALDLQVARLPTRMTAFALDAAVLLAVAVPLVLLVGWAAGRADPALQAALGIIVVVVVLVVVPTTVETLSRGRSVGKAALGLRVVRDDGGSVRFRHALVRALAGVFVDFVVTLGAGAVVTSTLSRSGKRVGDLLAGTVVVRERIPRRAPHAALMPPALAAWAAAAQLSALPDPVAGAAADLLARWPELAPGVREDLARRLASDVARAVSPPPPQGTSPPAYLTAVVAERHRRELDRLRRG
jgi:uncharacterized RDD family membrane protein YckC